MLAGRFLPAKGGDGINRDVRTSNTVLEGGTHLAVRTWSGSPAIEVSVVVPWSPTFYRTPWRQPVAAGTDCGGPSTLMSPRLAGP
jgi:hypothetical protein